MQYIQLPSPDEPAHGVLSTKHHGPFESPSQAVDGQPDCVVVQPVSVVVHELLHVHASHIEQPVQYGELHVHLLHHLTHSVCESAHEQEKSKRSRDACSMPPRFENALCIGVWQAARARIVLEVFFPASFSLAIHANQRV